MCNLPVQIEDSEKIVRAIMSPYHFDKKGNLRPGAFRSAPGTDEVSVVRQTQMGSDFCKSKAKEIAVKTANKTYRGLAVLIAARIRTVGAQVIDSQHIYCGHAHISYGFIVPANEPPESETNKKLVELTKGILKSAVYFEDQEPECPTWTGPSL
jgi:hypothetical protein